MGTMFAYLHRALKDRSVGSVNADIGAEPLLWGKTTSAASRKFPKFLIYYYTAKDSFFDQQFVHK